MSKFIVSYYIPKNNGTTVQNTTSCQSFDIYSILKNINTSCYKTEIERLRQLPELEYKKQKLLLPAFTPSGIFKVRKDVGLLEHSNILSFDVDGIKNPTDIKEALSIDPFVIGAFISPSGRGVKWFVLIDPLSHKESFTALAVYYEQEFGLVVDACGDVSRLCFVSHDEATYINDSPTLYQLPKTATNANTKSKPHLLHEVECIVKRIEEKAIDITEGYENWRKLGFSLASSIGEQGRDYFHRVSKFYHAYNHKEANEQFTNCLSGKKKGITLNSFFWMAKEKGINTTVSSSTFEAPLPPQKISIKNAYGEEITDRERIENAINEIYDIRRNIILDRVECKEILNKAAIWEPANEDDICRELELKRVKNCSPNRIKSIINSKFVKRFNPFKTYFENLPAYNPKREPDYIQQLADIVQLKNEEQDRGRFNKHFKKALVRCVACSLADEVNNLHYNKHAIIFISPAQSIGKTGFIRFLIPKELEMYCVEKMSFGNRDEQFTMQSSFIINLDEMASIEERNLQSVKSAMSTGIINVRKMNSGQRLIEPRRCNFFGNTNQTNILKDDTGSVRWLCFEVKGFNKDGEYWKEKSPLFVDINRVWAMAYQLFKNGFEFQLTHNEQIENEEANEMYKEDCIEEQLIKMHFTKSEKDKCNFKLTTQILQALANKNPILANKLNLNKIGSALKNLGFLYGQEYDKIQGFQLKGYYLKEM